MRLDVKFSESKQSFTANFGEVQNLSDGGYEKGYIAGYDDGYEKASEENQPNTGTCTIAVVPSANAFHHTLREIMEKDGSVGYRISRVYTNREHKVTARCDSVAFIVSTYTVGAEVTGGELLKVIANEGVIIKTPSVDGETVRVVFT